MLAESCLLSARLRPRVPRSARVSGLAIRMTSVLCSSPSAPILISLTIQAAWLLPSAGIQARKYLFRSRAPNLAAAPNQPFQAGDWQRVARAHGPASGHRDE